MRDLYWPIVVLACGAAQTAQAAAPTPRQQWALSVEINAAGCERRDALADVTIEPEMVGTTSGVARPLTADSIDVVEVSPGGRIVDRKTPFQFDRIGRGMGTLSILLGGRTRANASRHFRVSCRRAGKTFTPRKVPARLELAEDYEHEGQESFRIVTDSAWWYYHKRGAGFAGLLDPNGNDWIGYGPKGGSAGSYRGMPNLVHPEGYFHPGRTKCTSRLLAKGPLKVIIRSQSRDGKWACRWEITPAWARLTVLKAAGPYWFLYEGTPGGRLDVDGDYCVRSDGRRSAASERWSGDIAAPEWLYFGDRKLKRVLYLVHHEDDGHVDSYRPMQKNMTVFGFGRKGLTRHMTKVPARFTVGFCESTDHGTIAGAIAAATSPFKITVTPSPAPHE